MTFFLDALAWLTNGANWVGSGSIGVRLAQHLGVTFTSVAIACALALPVGILIGHLRRGAGIVGAITGSARAVPTLGLVTLVALLLGIGRVAPIIALVVLAIPSLLAGAYSGIQAIDREMPRSAKAIGMSSVQVITRVELPLAAPTIVGGIRAATLQVVATATLAAYTADLGLGRFLFAGLKTRDYAQMLGGALIVVVVALSLELLFSALQRLAWTRLASPTSNPTHTSSTEVPRRTKERS